MSSYKIGYRRTAETTVGAFAKGGLRRVSKGRYGDADRPYWRRADLRLRLQRDSGDAARTDRDGRRRVGQHVSRPYEAWISTDSRRGGVRVLITGPEGFERSVSSALDEDPAVIKDRVRQTLEDSARGHRRIRRGLPLGCTLRFLIFTQVVASGSYFPVASFATMPSMSSRQTVSNNSTPAPSTCWNVEQRRPNDPLQRRLPLQERQAPEVSAIEPQEVEGERKAMASGGEWGITVR